MFNTLSASEQIRKHSASQDPAHSPEGIRIIPVAKLQSELCAVMNLTADLSAPFYASRRGTITHAIIPASIAGYGTGEFVAAVEAFVSAHRSARTWAKEGGSHE